jgi:hypothetical protein
MEHHTVHHNAYPLYHLLQVKTEILHSICVSSTTLASPCNRATRMVWRLYMSSPTRNLSLHAGFLNIIKGIKYIYAIFSTGVTISTLLFCRICKSIDYMPPLCPFPQVPGWLGPQITSANLTFNSDIVARWKRKGMRRPQRV